jgi:hypothetical protein
MEGAGRTGGMGQVLFLCSGKNPAGPQKAGPAMDPHLKISLRDVDQQRTQAAHEHDTAEQEAHRVVLAMRAR